MVAELEFPIKAKRATLWNVFAYADNFIKDSGVSIDADDVPIDRKRFGADRAFVIRIGQKRLNNGMVILQELEDPWLLLVVPKGFGAQRLDPQRYWQVLRAFWRRLYDLNIVTLSEANELFPRLKEHQWKEYNRSKVGSG